MQALRNWVIKKPCQKFDPLGLRNLAKLFPPPLQTPPPSRLQPIDRGLGRQVKIRASIHGLSPFLFLNLHEASGSTCTSALHETPWSVASYDDHFFFLAG